MSFGGSILILTACVWLTFHYHGRMLDADTPYDRRWLIAWLVKGLVAPIALWISLNCGWPFPLASWWSVPQGGTWLQQKLILFAPGIAIAASYWSAATLGWWLLARVREVESSRDFIVSTAVWAAFLSPFIILLFYSFGLAGLGFIVTMGLLAIAHSTMLQLNKARTAPMYSKAIASIKFGKYDEAELEVLEELEKCENDFDGWMMLAELYATHFHDMPGAERTIIDLCKEPGLTPTQVSIAFHRLADWELKYLENPTAARHALAEVCKRFPGTHLARMSQLRIDQLPGSSEELRAQKKTKTIKLHSANTDLGLLVRPDAAQVGREEASALANECVEKLKQDPNDVEAREKLAHIFAEQMNALDLAMEQLELLIAMPEQPEKKIAHWLALMAGWQRKYRTDPARARKILERLIHEYPQSPQAFAAQRELYLMETEERLNRRKVMG
jgi:hypothetical protein